MQTSKPKEVSAIKAKAVLEKDLAITEKCCGRLFQLPDCMRGICVAINKIPLQTYLPKPNRHVGINAIATTAVTDHYRGTRSNSG